MLKRVINSKVLAGITIINRDSIRVINNIVLIRVINNLSIK